MIAQIISNMGPFDYVERWTSILLRRKVDTDYGTPTRVFDKVITFQLGVIVLFFINFENGPFLTKNHFKYESCGIIKCVSDKKT